METYKKYDFEPGKACVNQRSKHDTRSYAKVAKNRIVALVVQNVKLWQVILPLQCLYPVIMIQSVATIWHMYTVAEVLW